MADKTGDRQVAALIERQERARRIQQIIRYQTAAAKAARERRGEDVTTYRRLWKQAERAFNRRYAPRWNLWRRWFG